MTEREKLLEQSSDTPDMPKLIDEFETCVDRRDSNIFTRMRLNYEARYCIWGGQNEDGRKHKKDLGNDLFPWEGASDARVPLIDKYLREDVALLMTTWQRMKTVVAGVEAGDASFGNRMTQFLRWMKYTQMDEARDESRLLANLMLEKGMAVLGIFWDRQRQLSYQEVDLENIKAGAMEAQQRIGTRMEQPQDAMAAMLPEVILDPAQEEVALDYGQQLLPELSRNRLRRVLADLRKEGFARFPYPYLFKDRPSIVALEANQDVFLPPEATSMQTTWAVYRRECLTETALRERVQSHDWDAAWVKEVLKTQRGVITAPERKVYYRSGPTRQRQLEWNTDKLFEVVHAYRRMGDAEGVPGIFYTCFHRHLSKNYAWHGLLNYDHGEMPFVTFQRERTTRILEDSRGYGECAYTMQKQIKVEWDARVDRASVSTLPPMYHPPGEDPQAWGPGVRVPTMRPDAFGYFDSPKFDPQSKEVEDTVRRFTDEYFGRPVDEQNKVQAELLRQELADAWMGAWAKVDTQILQLCQQFMPEQFYYRVVGSKKAQSIRSTREEIQGRFDLTITYSVADLDVEYVTEKLKLLEKVLTYDINGIVDRDEVLQVAFELMDPNLGERVLKPSENATMQEVDDEKDVFAKLFAGVFTDVKPGQAYQVRARTLQEIMSQNPTAQQRYADDPHFQELVDKRLKQLNFQITQQQNAVIGRLGA